MPDESCRRCGGMLIKSTLCASCRGTIQRICIKCGLKTAEQVHNECFYMVESFQTRVDNLDLLNILLLGVSGSYQTNRNLLL